MYLSNYYFFQTICALSIDYFIPFIPCECKTYSQRLPRTASQKHNINKVFVSVLGNSVVS